MSRLALTSLVVSLAIMGILAAAPVLNSTDALACGGGHHPSGKLIAIDEALPTAKITPAKIAEVKELRQKAYGLTASGKLAEAGDVADRALKILGVELKPELSVPPTRC